MRLSKIKLAGFKSFVDPTSLKLPGNLTGIVGPNGCGKSNVIDAVRWVMGESSAKTLRGESMADVIFNGSSARKPVGTASIELMFDNSAGRAGGQYTQYNTISVKRQVSRDGTSLYYLNGVRCRRRDITDLFLGTGLGPRSYSIIEQGMISRLIEARPEELRVFLEEAAGISKYKERRQETENRIRHTRENLDRLNDLREEIEKRKRDQEIKDAQVARVEKQHAAIVDLALRESLFTGDIAKAAQIINETAAKILDVARCSIWLIDEEKNNLEVVDLYQTMTAVHESDLALDLLECPSFFHALQTERSVAVSDMLTDPRTADLVDYARATGVSALLDSPLRVGGRLRGVVCFEHSGGQRRWHDDDIVGKAVQLLPRPVRAEVKSEHRSVGRLEASDAHSFEILGQSVSDPVDTVAHVHRCEVHVGALDETEADVAG